jgi:hypothetical protein
VLRVRSGKTGQHDTPVVGLAVIVCVLEIQNIGSRGDQNATPPAHDARRQHQRVREHARSLELPVAVSILEQFDPAGWRNVQRITRHFHDEHPAILVDLHRDRALDVRLAGDELDPEAVLDLHGLHGPFWRVGRTFVGRI